MLRYCTRRTILWPLITLRPASGAVDGRFGVLESIHDPTEVRRTDENHVPHRAVIRFNRGSQFRLRYQVHRAGNRFAETLPGLPEGEEMMRRP